MEALGWPVEPWEPCSLFSPAFWTWDSLMDGGWLAVRLRACLQPLPQSSSPLLFWLFVLSPLFHSVPHITNEGAMVSVVGSLQCTRSLL